MTTPTILDHDGSTDDIAALIVAVLAPQIDLHGVIVTDGDCHLLPAAASSAATCATLGLPEVPIWPSDIVVRRAFPDRWRETSWQVSNLPLLRRSCPDAVDWAYQAHRDAHDHLLDAVKTTENLTLIVTGPLSNLATLENTEPGTLRRCADIYWMGGAIDVAGNVDEAGHDGTAEWNAYADSAAAQNVLSAGPPITIVPLDATTKAPLDDEFLDALNHITTTAGDLAAQLYALVRHHAYEMWDVLTVAAMLWPDLFTFEPTGLDVTVGSRADGRTRRSHTGPTHRVAVDVNSREVLARVLETLATPQPGGTS